MRLVAAGAVLQLFAGLMAFAVVREPAEQASIPDRARIALDRTVEGPARLDTSSGTPPQDRVPLEDERATAVAELLQGRSAAILGRDRAAFLATVDPMATALESRQAAMFDALAEVPISGWDYTLDALSSRPAESKLDLRYGRGQWWSPEVSLSYTLAGFDERPTTDVQYLTFVRRDGRWLLGADDDFAAAGAATPRALWERGPVVAVRAPGVLALGHADTALLRNVAAVASAAIPRVSAVWGEQWRRQVVAIVPATPAELSSLLDSDQDLSQIAAVTSARYAGPPDVNADAVDRILVNPETFPKLGQLGRRVVLTHEMTHVATRRATGPSVPAWLAEGLADYIGYKDVKVPLEVAARDLRKDVRAGRLPVLLPDDEFFGGGSSSLAQAYEQSWLAVRLLAERYGEDDLLRFYRAVGANRQGSRSTVLAAELQDAFGVDTVTFIADWRAALQRQLG